MRRTVLATAATLAILAVGSLVPNRAEAMTVTTPIGIQAAIDGTNLVQDVACRRVWRCGPYGCGWRRVCWRAAPYYGGYGYLWWRTLLRWLLSALPALLVVS